ncbi:MAG TPA: DNA mismatch repair protein MutS [Chromatiales bacterium]|nr:DNA mismatch repair protein MutS [Chromatiales bacterium]
MDDKKDDLADAQDLFRQAMADARPLQSDRVAPYRRKLRPDPLPKANQGTQAFTAEVADRDIETHDELLFVRAGIQQRLFADLRRGKIIPDASIDLHGLRVAEARVILAEFLQECWDRRFRCVRIIHGKGRGSGSQQPVLKQKVNQWLPQWNDVLAFCSAPRWDGGTGAAYVLLRRKRLDQGPL